MPVAGSPGGGVGMAAPGLSRDSSYCPEASQGLGVSALGTRTESTAGPPLSHHLFTRWKYFCRKPGSTELLQSSSCVWG